MVPPVWLDEAEQPLPARPGSRCGAAVPIRRYRVDQMKSIGWGPLAVASHVEWCGHEQEFVTLPHADGWWWLVPILGEAA